MKTIMKYEVTQKLDYVSSRAENLYWRLLADTYDDDDRMHSEGALRCLGHNIVTGKQVRKWLAELQAVELVVTVKEDGYSDSYEAVRFTRHQDEVCNA
jgi:hypothetical protein